MFDRDAFFGLVEEISTAQYLQDDKEILETVIPKVEDLNEYVLAAKRVPKEPNQWQKLFLNDRFNNGFGSISLIATACLVIFFLVTPDKKLQNQYAFGSVIACFLPAYIWGESTKRVKKNLNLPID
jgi:hypothetical protein